MSSDPIIFDAFNKILTNDKVIGNVLRTTPDPIASTYVKQLNLENNFLQKTIDIQHEKIDEDRARLDQERIREDIQKRDIDRKMSDLFLKLDK